MRRALQVEQAWPGAGGAALLPLSSSGSARSQARTFRKAHAGPALEGGNLVLVLLGGLCRHPELSETTQQGPISHPLQLKGTERGLSASSPQDTRLEGEGR